MAPPILQGDAKYWDPSVPVKVYFTGENPDAGLVNAVKKYAVAWEPFANIKFKFTDQAEFSEPCIEITFVELPTGSFTVERTGVKVRMCLEKSRFLKREITEAEFGRVVIHEFGHALGAEHEHQREETRILWNKGAVKKAFQKINRRTGLQYCEFEGTELTGQCAPDYDGSLKGDLFDINTPELTPREHMSVYDPLSIMHYPIPSGYTENIPEIVIEPNMFLSKIDKAWIAKYYPHTQPALEFNSFDCQYDTPVEIIYPRPTLGPQARKRTGGLVKARVKQGHSLHVGTYNLKTSLASDIVSARVDFLVTPPDDRRFKVGTFNKKFKKENLVVPKKIKFDLPFLEPDPVVIVWLDSIHCEDSARATRVKVYASDITSEGFTIHLDSTDDSSVVYAGGSWVAYPKDTPDIQTGNITPANTSREKDVPFNNNDFNQNSNLMIAVNQLDFDAGKDIEFAVSASAISAKMMNIYVDPHVGATYLALAHHVSATYLALPPIVVP